MLFKKEKEKIKELELSISILNTVISELEEKLNTVIPGLEEKIKKLEEKPKTQKPDIESMFAAYKQMELEKAKYGIDLSDDAEEESIDILKGSI